MEYGVEKYVAFDLGMLSKYHYYTGVIFKAYTYGVGDAIVTGGRYDTLLARFGKKAAAIGFMIIIDDLMEALSRQKIDVQTDINIQTLTYNLQNYSEVIGEAKKLRSQNISVRLIKDFDETNEGGAK